MRTTWNEARTRDEVQRYMKERSLNYMYGITLDQFMEMLRRQEGKCAICGEDITRVVKGRIQACVDHDHSTEAVRGLLCSACNKGLGFFRDNTRVMRAAILYITNHKLR